MKILIIEDEDVLAKVLQEKLKKANFDVKISSDGVEAIANIKRLKMKDLKTFFKTDFLI